MSNKKRIIKDIAMISIGILMLVAFIYLGSKENKEKEKTQTAAEIFATKYTKLDKSNVFVTKTAAEIIKVLESGNGVVFLGFPECKWCQSYVVYLNEVAKKVGLKEIYYFDIREDRANNTEDYKKIVSLLKKYLAKDSKEEPRVYVPNVTFIKNGKIIGNDYETALEDSGEPEEYWTEKKVSSLKAKLEDYMVKVVSETCESCN